MSESFYDAFTLLVLIWKKLQMLCHSSFHPNPALLYLGRSWDVAPIRVHFGSPWVYFQSYLCKPVRSARYEGQKQEAQERYLSTAILCQ